MTTCKKVYRFICENIDEDLHSPRCRQIRQHIEGCTDCHEYLRSLKRTINLYKNERVGGLSPTARRRLISSLTLELFPVVPKIKPAPRHSIIRRHNS